MRIEDKQQMALIAIMNALSPPERLPPAAVGLPGGGVFASGGYDGQGASTAAWVWRP
ncbi:MAG: hypothetical protein ACT4P7_22330 [Gemmatimonadaceae bacterium]